MFENFVIFTEVSKLSSDIFYQLRKINYSNKFLDLIYRKRDIVSFEEITNLLEDRSQVEKFIGIILQCRISHEKGWIKNISKVLDYIDFDFLTAIC